ncbi:MAG: serine--tRNA ligase [Clostridiales bacterium]|nr:serine--tRNA ligase [Clostridiales bacterium]MDO4349889.1 serine--tRNA ligase [Eubacteriales bacterium]MDY4008384.1 serine--tRNA ligase [Candidatus Limiplasma sp.]
MLDIKRIRQNPQELRDALKARNKDISIDPFLAKDEQRRKLMGQVEEKKALRNATSKKIGAAKKNGASDAEMASIMEEMRKVGDEITDLDAQIAQLDADMDAFLMTVPNFPHASVPYGVDDHDNVEKRRWGTPRTFAWEPKAHWDIGTDLGILDFDTAAKVSGARFTFYRGLGARLERAIINFFLNTHVENGYDEVYPPYMVTRATMTGTGQLPKFEEDAYKVDKDTFLIPTAEVPVTNMYREMILDGAQLPIRHCAYSTCFRAEAGSAGRDTRGLIRQHQFNKVEMVKVTKPEQSYDELESMTAEAEKVLQLLGLPYRVVTLCSGDMGFSAAKTYDIEVWMPSYGRYVEISSCSNCEDFQARRAGIRYRENPKDKPRFAHTLNGSGVAVGRTVAAILENYQNEDGTVTVPEALVPYMGTHIIK